MERAYSFDFLSDNSCVWQPIATGGAYIESFDSFKLLGVHINKDLSWVVHCDCVIQKANRRLYALRNLRPKSGAHPGDSGARRGRARVDGAP